MYYVIQPPSTMEDQGRSFLHGSFRTAEKAEEKINELIARSQGYFTRDSFVIARPQHDF